MNKTRWMVVATLVLGLAAGCGDSSTPDDGDDSAQNGKSDNFGDADERTLKTWDLDALAEEGFAEDPDIIQDARIEGDELVLDVQYGGGCEEHGFRLHWDGLILESFPPQANLTLYHDFNNDFCEALKFEELRFDISGLAGGEIILNVVGTDHSLSYVGEGGEPGPKGLFTGDPADLENRGFRSDGASITNAVVEGSTLSLDVSYGGGCEEHEFELAWNGIQLESLPPQTSLTLYHNSNNDFCEAFLSETLTFDISALGTDEIIVHLTDTEISLTVGGTSEPTPAAQPLYMDDPDALSLQGFRSSGQIIGDARIEDGKLLLDVSYGGGCAEHDFELYWSGIQLESFPPQTSLVLYHNSNGDNCEAFLSETIAFDLEPLSGGPIVIHLADSDFSVTLEE